MRLDIHTIQQFRSINCTMSNFGSITLHIINNVSNFSFFILQIVLLFVIQVTFFIAYNLHVSGTVLIRKYLIMS